MGRYYRHWGDTLGKTTIRDSGDKIGIYRYQIGTKKFCYYGRLRDAVAKVEADRRRIGLGEKICFFDNFLISD